MEDISIWISRLGKEDCLHQCGWTSSNPLRAEIEQKGGGSANAPSLFELRQPSFPVLRLVILVLGLSWVLHHQPPDSQACGLAPKLHHWLSWFSSLQMAPHGLLTDFLITWANSNYIYIYSIGNSTYICLYFLLAFCFSVEAWLIQFRCIRTPYIVLPCRTISKSRCLLKERNTYLSCLTHCGFLLLTAGRAGSPLCFEHVNKILTIQNSTNICKLMSPLLISPRSSGNPNLTQCTLYHGWGTSRKPSTHNRDFQQRKQGGNVVELQYKLIIHSQNRIADKHILSITLLYGAFWWVSLFPPIAHIVLKCWNHKFL